MATLSLKVRHGLPLLLTAAVGLSGCSGSPRGGAAEQALGDCARDFVEVTPASAGCDFSLTIAGSLRYDGRALRDLSVILYQQHGGGSMTVPAEKVVLFPASPSGRFRIVQACLNATTNGMCFQTLVFDRQAALEEVWAGQYGPIRWLRWSPDEQFVALVSHNEGASSIHIIEAANGRSFEYPAKVFHQKWQVQQETFAWTGPRKFTIKIADCPDCAAEQKELEF